MDKVKSGLGVAAFGLGLLCFFIYLMSFAYYIPELIYIARTLSLLLVLLLFIPSSLIFKGVKILPLVSYKKVAKRIFGLFLPVALIVSYVTRPNLSMYTSENSLDRLKENESLILLQHGKVPEFDKTISTFVDAMAISLQSLGQIKETQKKWKNLQAIRWLRIAVGKNKDFLEMVRRADNISYWKVGLAGEIFGFCPSTRFLRTLEQHGFVKKKSVDWGETRYYPTSLLREATRIIKKEGPIYSGGYDSDRGSVLKQYSDKILNQTLNHLNKALEIGTSHFASKYSPNAIIQDAIRSQNPVFSILDAYSGINDMKTLVDMSNEINRALKDVENGIQEMTSILNSRDISSLSRGDFSCLEKQYEHKVDLIAFQGIVFCDYYTHIESDSKYKHTASRWRNFFKNWRDFFSVGDKRIGGVLGLKSSGSMISPRGRGRGYAVLVSTPISSRGANLDYVISVTRNDLSEMGLPVPRRGNLWRAYYLNKRYTAKNGIIPLLGKLTFAFKSPTNPIKNLGRASSFGSIALSKRSFDKFVKFRQIIGERKFEIRFLGKRLCKYCRDGKVLNAKKDVSKTIDQLIYLYNLYIFLSGDFSYVKNPNGAVIFGSDKTVRSVDKLLKCYESEKSFSQHIDSMISGIKTLNST